MTKFLFFWCYINPSSVRSEFHLSKVYCKNTPFVLIIVFKKTLLHYGVSYLLRRNLIQIIILSLFKIMLCHIAWRLFRTFYGENWNPDLLLTRNGLPLLLILIYYIITFGTRKKKKCTVVTILNILGVKKGSKAGFSLCTTNVLQMLNHVVKQGNSFYHV